MEIFIIIALVTSVTGAISAPAIKILVDAYTEERKRLESGQPPSYLPGDYVSEFRIETSPKIERHQGK